SKKTMKEVNTNKGKKNEKMKIPLKKARKIHLMVCQASKSKKYATLKKMRLRNKLKRKKRQRKIKLIINSKGGYNMAITLENNVMKDFENKKKDYMDLMKAEDSTPEQLEESFSNMFDALQNDLAQKITSEAKDEVHDAQILAARGQNVLTSKERKF